MSDKEVVTLETDLACEDAAQRIAKAVSGRRAIARKYVMRIRRRHPDATPTEVIKMLERHYSTAISTAGAVIAAGAIAVDVGIAMIPVAGAATAGAKSASQQAAKKAGKEATKVAAKTAAKVAAKNIALGTAKTGAQRVAGMLPAGDEQLQFEITSIFVLSVADIHGMDLDQDQASALVLGVSNGRLSQQMIATMAADLFNASQEETDGVDREIAEERADCSHWANTLAEALPAGYAQSLVQTIQTGELNIVRETLSGKQQTVIEYGVGAVAGGVAHFVFGHEVVNATQLAFAEAPDDFPEHLALQIKAEPDDDGREVEPSRALAVLEESAKATGNLIADAAGTVGRGVATGAVAAGTGLVSAAGTVARPFRSVDLDGDGIPDAPMALTKVKDVGGVFSGAAGAVSGSVTGLFKSRKRNEFLIDRQMIDSDEASDK